MNEKVKVFDTLIVGSGPAGLTAAIYNSRADLKTIVIAGNQPGGQLTITTLVDNYPGFPKGIGGIKLMMDMQEQVRNLGVEIRAGVVKKINQNKLKKNNTFKIELENGEILESKSVIVGTGAAVKWLGLKNEKELIGHGVSGCATCDGMFFRDKEVGVVGGGDTACEEADFLSRFCKKVYLIHRRAELRATAAEQRKVLNNPKIEILWNNEVREIKGKEKLEGIILFDNKKYKEKELKIDGLFMAIGNKPATDFLKDIINLDENGQILVGTNQDLVTMTNIEGIFAAGDCVNANHKQAVVAAGEGCRAALDAEKWLEK